MIGIEENKMAAICTSYVYFTGRDTLFIERKIINITYTFVQLIHWRHQAILNITTLGIMKRPDKMTPT